MVERGEVRVRRGSTEPGALSVVRTLAFGVGHFYNDLCACLWFSFLVIFCEKVVMLSSIHSGVVILVGQLTDAVATPLVGLASDSLALPPALRRYGRRKVWHLAGSLLVSASFPFIFNILLPARHDLSDWTKIAWLLPFVVCFQVGWASVQISHLALIPQLAPLPSQRTTLNALRNVFTIVAQVTVFSLMIWRLGIGRDKLSPSDAPTFRLVDLVVVGLGASTTGLFHLGTKEPLWAGPQTASQAALGPGWRDWLRRPRFWLTALLYMSSRLYINVSQVYMGLYVEYTQDMDKKFVALIPLMVCLSSFVVSTLLSVPAVNRLVPNAKLLYAVGASVGGVGCVWMWTEGLGPEALYGVAAVLGVAQAIVLVTSLGATADLIGNDSTNCAFVYGSMSLADKLVNGLCYQAIQVLDPSCEEGRGSHPACRAFFRDVVVLVPAAALALALLACSALLLFPSTDSSTPYSRLHSLHDSDDERASPSPPPVSALADPALT